MTEVIGEAEPVLASPEGEPRGMAGVLQSFMEEKNIRWGELVSGLLIVISSIGLVRSLWATLSEWIPYFPVAVFLAATAAMHGAGLYTLRRWRLKSTSRGLLLVSTLLVPLNVLAAMVLNAKKSAYDPIDYAAVTLGLAVLAGLVLSAARILNRRQSVAPVRRSHRLGRGHVADRPADRARRKRRTHAPIVRDSVCLVLCCGHRAHQVLVGRQPPLAAACRAVVSVLRNRPLFSARSRPPFWR